MMRTGIWSTLVAPLLAAMVLIFSPIQARGESVTVLSDPGIGPPVEHGLAMLTRSLEEKGLQVALAHSLQGRSPSFVVIAGAPGGEVAASALQSLGLEVPDAPESLLIRHLEWQGTPALLIAGADERGLMYGLLEVANRVSWATDSADPFQEVADVAESPDIAERAVSIYTMHRRHFESRFFDDAHWARYFDVLAESRFNAVALLFAYENAGYFAPAYPYFFDVEEFPDVHVIGFSKEDQQKHVRALKRFVEMAHARGLDVTVGLWDHIYRGGVQAGGMDVEAASKTPGIVWGLTPDNLYPYTQLALTKFLKTFPEIDAVQFRMHGESGLRREEMHDFWKTVYEVMNEHAPHMRFDARAKEFPDSLIDLAVDMNVNIRIATKYWAEQMGMPFHPSHINYQNQYDRRHGYADLLRYPKTYDMHWRLWNGGTARILLWGDPDYVRRFVESTHLYDGKGFEVNEMLATKMASQPHDMEPFELLTRPYRYYESEFDRYWHFYQLFGRLGYNPETPEEVWAREFDRRFGVEAGPHVMKGLHAASRILPMINGYNFPYNDFPTTRGWAEKERREDLPDYAAADPSDTQQFSSMSEAARLTLRGESSAKVLPAESARWFSRTADEVLRHAVEAERLAGRNPSKELAVTLVDLRILGHLARYHSKRALAGRDYALWKASEDLNALDSAIAREEEAIAAWGNLVEAAGNVYAENLRMGLARAGLSGHWKDELSLLRTGLVALEAERDGFHPDTEEGPPLSIAHAPVLRHSPGTGLTVRATVAGRDPAVSVRAAYRTDPKAPYRFVTLEPAGKLRFSGTIPLDGSTGRLEYYIEARDRVGRRSTAPFAWQSDPFVVAVTDDDQAPSIRHAKKTSHAAGQALELKAAISDPSGVKWARIRYRGVNQHQDFKTIEMKSNGADEFSAVVPGEDIVSTWDFMYLIEAMDGAGNGIIYPDLYVEQPYVVVRLVR